MMESIEYIKSDLFRLRGEADLTGLVKSYLLNSTFRWQVAFRMVRGGVLPARFIGRVLWFLRPARGRIQISRETEIGYGLYIGHGGPVVVNPTAVIGDNCNLSQFVTIGSNSGKAARTGGRCLHRPERVRRGGREHRRRLDDRRRQRCDQGYTGGRDRRRQLRQGPELQQPWALYKERVGSTGCSLSQSQSSAIGADAFYGRNKWRQPSSKALCSARWESMPTGDDGGVSAV